MLDNIAMRHKSRQKSAALTASVLAIALLGVAGCARSRVTVVDDAALKAADADASNWITYGRLIALDAKTGTVVWDVQTTPKDGPYAITGAPRIAKGRVIIGNAGAEYAVRGYVSAYDAETGNLVWKTYTVPGDPSKPFESDAMRKAAATWSGEWWKAGGGGTAWDTIVYDPDLDFVFFGTGNGSPWYDRLRGKGDNLYVASIVALRADNGEQVWAYQTTRETTGTTTPRSR